MTEESRASVVEIRTSSGTGTGWIYRVDNSRKAWILTNEHVIRGSRTVTVRLLDGSGTRIGTVRGQDDIRDLAVVTICCNSGWKALPTVVTTDIEVGSDVVVMGFPEQRIGSGISVTTGIVSSFDFHNESRSWLIQTDAAVNPGNSGGPIMNAAGQVIGVVSSRIDPVRAENIGFAIAMRTVDAELDYLEVGESVRAATPTPTPRATRVPTPAPSTGGVSGVWYNDPRDNNIECSANRRDQSVISDSTIDSAAFLRFEVPDVHQWSIGFIYHDPYGAKDTDTATFVYASSAGDIRARHWVRSNGEDIHEPPSERIRHGTLSTGRGELNELMFRTSASGTLLRLNDEIVIEVPASQLERKNGWSRVCVGFHSGEEPYSIRYEDLRTRFVKEDVSGNIQVPESDLDDGFITCPDYRWSSGFIADDVIDAWVLMDVVFPTVADWSFGVIYHDTVSGNSRSKVYRSDYSHYTDHTTDNNGNFEDGPLEYISSSRFNSGIVTIDILEFETTANGSWLRLNGKKILDVDSSELKRRTGSIEVCANLLKGEPVPYEITYSDLWAWTD